MNSKTKKIGFSILTILLLALWVGFRNPVKADGTSAGASAPMMRASIPSSTRSITLSNAMTNGPGYTIVSPSSTGSTYVDLIDPNEIYLITGTTSTYGINVSVDCTIILDNVSITSPILTAGIGLNGHTVTIILNTGSTNTILSAAQPAIHCDPLSTLVLKGDGTLVADSSGTSDCAGIGGRVVEDGGTVTICENVTVTAIGGNLAAGIGGGDQGNGGTITIKDTATVTATGGGGAAGIGGGQNIMGPFGGGGNGGVITIEGSATVTATSGVGGGAGIGGGLVGSSGSITIKDSAIVNATALSGGGPGIGSGFVGTWGPPTGGTINISGGTVTAQGQVGIGGGAENITISGGDIVATGTGSVGIGDDSTSFGSLAATTVTITGGTITAQGDTSHNGIDGSAVEITGGNLLSRDGSGASPSTSIYSNASSFSRAYPSILTVPGITTPQPVTAFSTTDGVTYYTLSGATTITDGAQQVFSVWLPVTTASQTVYVTIGGITYEASYVRPASMISQLLTISNISVTGITLDKSTLTLLPNLSEGITATVLPTTATNASVTWSSSDLNIATVDTKGIVIAKSVGTATITATTMDGNYAAHCVVTVNPATYTVTPGALTFTGGTGDLTFKVNEPAMTELQSVMVNGSTLNASNYTVTSGSTVITLKNSWLIGQSNGTYAIIANFTHGQAGITLTINQSSTSPSGSVGGTTIPGGNAGGTNTSKEFWYPNSSGTTSSSSANGGSATSPDSPNYNPATGGEVDGISTLTGFFLLATIGSAGLYMGKHKK